MKTSKQLERYFKGVSNHRRIDILNLVHKRDGITVENIAEVLNGNMKTISEHIRRLAQAGLLRKEYQGREVKHSLSPFGRKFISFIRTF